MTGGMDGKCMLRRIRFRGLFSSGALVSPVPLSSANFKQGVFFMIDFRIFAKEKSFRLGLSAPGRSIV